ncbi:MAG: MmgE/PrpD family protein [bacterium]
MKKKKYTREIAEWVSSVRYEDIPQAVIEEAKNQILSVLGAVYAGALSEPAVRLAEGVHSPTDGVECTYLPRGGKGSIHNVMLANLAHSIALDYDDYLIAGHTGHSAVLAPLALAETLDVGGRDLLVAQVIANEVAARIGAAVMVGPLNGQMMTYIHAAGAACAAGRLMGLTAEEIQSALGIALAQPGYGLIPGFLGSDAKLLCAGTAALAGVTAARLAANGVKGFPDILEHHEGFCRASSYIPLLPILSGLGYTWLSSTLSYKIYPGCAYIDAVMDALLEIVRSEQPEPENIDRIDVYASLLTVKMDDFARPFIRREATSPVTLNFYTPYNVAAGIIDGELTPIQLAPNRIKDSAVWNLAKRVRVHHDLHLTGQMIDELARVVDFRYLMKGMNWKALVGILKQVGPAPWSRIAGVPSVNEVVRDILTFTGRALRAGAEIRHGEFVPDDIQSFSMKFGARVEIRLKNGKVHESAQDIPFGAAGRSIEEKRIDVINKFRQEASLLLSDRTVGYLLNKIFDFENLKNQGILNFIQICAGAAEAGRDMQHRAAG